MLIFRHQMRHLHVLEQYTFNLFVLDSSWSSCERYRNHNHVLFPLAVKLADLQTRHVKHEDSWFLEMTQHTIVWVIYIEGQSATTKFSNSSYYRHSYGYDLGAHNHRFFCEGFPVNIAVYPCAQSNISDVWCVVAKCMLTNILLIF